MRNLNQRRWGAIGPLTAIMLIPLVAMVAFAVDLGYIWRCDAELQNAADSAALAGAAALMDANVRANGSQPVLSASELKALRQTATLKAVATAEQYAEYHQGGGVLLVIDTGNDVAVGYIEDPTASPSTAEGAFQTGANAPFPNSVRVTTRRDDNVSTGKLGLFFANVLGTADVSRTASATATLRGGTIAGFTKANPYILPIAMQLDTYKWLTGQTTKPPTGLTAQDTFTVDMEDSSPVTGGGDGIFEAKIFPDMPSGTTPSVMGTISLDHNVGNPGASDLARWINDGITNEEAASWNEVTKDRGLYATPNEPLWMDVKTGINASMKDDLAAQIGRPTIIPIFDQTNNGNGSNTQFRVVGFVGVTIVDLKLTGSKSSKHVTVQITGVMTDSVTLADSNSNSHTSYVYTGVSLSR